MNPPAPASAMRAVPHLTPDADIADAATPRFIPVERGPRRLAGGFVIGPEEIAWRPAVDVERVILAGMGLGAAVLAATVALRGRGGAGPVRTVTMGPGGWVSFRGTEAPRVVGVRRRTRPSARRPWWAVLLRAQPLS